VLRRPGADHCPTHCPRQTYLAEKRVPLRSPGRRACRTLVVGPGSHLPDLHEGYSATAGDDWMRPTLCEDALRLAHLAELARMSRSPRGSRAHGDSSVTRRAVGPSGEPILLFDQNRAHWTDSSSSRFGRTSSTLKSRRARGAYALQAAIAACHARALTPGETDWRASSRSMRRLGQVTPSPIVELESRVAVAMHSDLRRASSS